jgi:hypothetical protein
MKKAPLAGAFFISASLKRAAPLAGSSPPPTRPIDFRLSPSGFFVGILYRRKIISKKLINKTG